MLLTPTKYLHIMSRIVLDQTTGHYRLGKLTHETVLTFPEATFHPDGPNTKAHH